MIRARFRTLLILAVGASLVSAAMGQGRKGSGFTADKYVISAIAGGVNYTEGEVSVVRAAGKSGLLLRDDQLEIGDRVSTSTDGRAEILLNPGSYLRLGTNSAFEFKTVSLDDLQLRLFGGTAMFEVFASDEFTVTVITPKGRVALIDSGVYRIDVAADGSGVVAVTDGKALVGVADPTEIKKGRTGTITGGSVTVAKFDRNKRDDFAEWGRSRAKDLAKMTASLKNREVRTSLMSSFNSGRWGLFDSFGLWVFNPSARGYCFLPFGYDWYSPYGYGYGTGLYWYNLPPAIHFPPATVAGPGIKPPRAPVRDFEPPYTRVEKIREPIRPIRAIDFPTDRSDPVRIFQPPPTVSLPAPATGDKKRQKLMLLLTLK